MTYFARDIAIPEMCWNFVLHFFVSCDRRFPPRLLFLQVSPHHACRMKPATPGPPSCKKHALTKIEFHITRAKCVFENGTWTIRNVNDTLSGVAHANTAAGDVVLQAPKYCGYQLKLDICRFKHEKQEPHSGRNIYRLVDIYF